MARDILNDLTNVDQADGDFPRGRVRDVSGAGISDGTPVVEIMVGDMIQFFQKLMADSGIVPNNLPDNVSNTFQLYTAFINTVLQNTQGVITLKGVINASSNPNYPAGVVGDAYLFSVSGKIGGGSGVDVSMGDMLICLNDNPGGTEFAVGSDWFVLERNFEVDDLTIEVVGGVMQIKNQGVTLGKIQNVSTAIILGRSTVGSGSLQQLSPSTVRSLINVAEDKILPQTMLGRTAAGNGPVEQLTASQVRIFLNINEGDFVENAGNSGAKTRILTKIIEIGDWNMDTDESVTVDAGISKGNIRGVSVQIKSDIGIPIIGTPHSNIFQGGYYMIGNDVFGDDQDITIFRDLGGVFDNTSYNSTPYNRGWVMITYEE